MMSDNQSGFVSVAVSICTGRTVKESSCCERTFVSASTFVCFGDSRKRCTARFAETSENADGNGKNGDDENDEMAVHPSWFIYQQPGNKCVVCFGEGRERCLYCYGKGTIVIGTQSERDTTECPLCDGAGSDVCTRCEGTGVRPDWKHDLNTGERVPNKTNEDICKELVFDDSKYKVAKTKAESNEEKENAAQDTKKMSVE